MRSIMLISLALLTSTASGQELMQEAPLEAIRPRTTPIELKEDPPPPPPPRKVVRKKVPRAPVVQTTNKQVVRTQTRTKTNRPETTAAPLPPVAPTRVVRKKVSDPVAPPVATQAPVPVRPPVVRRVIERPPVERSAVERTVVEKPAPVVERAPAPPRTAVTPAPPLRVQKTTVTETKTTTARSTKARGHGGGRRRALLNFRAASIYATRNSTSSGSFILGWDPVILPYKRFNFGLSLGATRFESESLPGHSAAGFFVYEYGVSTSYYVSRSFLPELIIGMQTWKESNKATSNLLIAANANYLFRRRPMGGHLDRLYAGYGMLSTSGGGTHILRAGIGFRF